MGDINGLNCGRKNNLINCNTSTSFVSLNNGTITVTYKFYKKRA